MEKTKKVIITTNQISALFSIMDAGVKTLGLSCVHSASYLVNKFETAEDVKQDNIINEEETDQPETRVTPVEEIE